MLGFSRTSWTRFAREGSWVLAGQLVTAAAGLVGVRVLTELAPRAVFGEASLWLGVLVLARNFFLVPVSMFQLRYHPDYVRQGQAGTFTGRIRHFLRRSTAVFLLAGGLAYLGWVWLAPEQFRPVLLFGLACIACLDAAKTVRQNALNADRRQKAFAGWSAVEGWAVVVLTAAALGAAPTTESYLLGTAAGYLLPLVLFQFLIPTAVDTRSSADGTTDDRAFYRQVVAYGLPFLPLAVVVWITNLGDRYILNVLRGTEEVALYVAAFGIASKPALLLGGVVALAARPVLFNAVSGGRTPAARRVFRMWLAGTVLLNAGLVAVIDLLGPWIARWFLAAEYRPGAPALMTWIAAGYAVYSAVQVLENRIMSFGRSAALIAPVSGGAGLKLILTYVFVLADGPLGAARATFAAFVGQFLMTGWALARVSESETHGAANEPSVPPDDLRTSAPT